MKNSEREKNSIYGAVGPRSLRSLAGRWSIPVRFSLKLLVLVLAAGCVDKHVLINHWYREDGYLVKGMHGKYNWDEKAGVATLTTGDGFEERTYTDRDRDGLPEEIKFNNEIIHRSTEGTEEIFERADRDFEQARRRYEIADVEADWRRMSPDERALKNRYFTR